MIKEARTSARLSQRGLAERAGSSQPAVARRERGVEDPTVAMLRRLLFACGQRLVLDSEPLPASPRREVLSARRDEIIAVVAREGGSNVRVFGSVARGDDDDESDIDLLVDFPPSVHAGMILMTVGALKDELTDLLRMSVDVTAEPIFKPEVRRSALKEAVPL